MGEQQTFFGVAAEHPGSEIKRYQKPKPKYPGLYAAEPGTGPDRETCRTCKHKTYKPGVAGSYLKCRLTRKHWTGGAGTDIKARTPACNKWEQHPREKMGKTIFELAATRGLFQGYFK